MRAFAAAGSLIAVISRMRPFPFLTLQFFGFLSLFVSFFLAYYYQFDNVQKQNRLDRMHVLRSIISTHAQNMHPIEPICSTPSCKRQEQTKSQVSVSVLLAMLFVCVPFFLLCLVLLAMPTSVVVSKLSTSAVSKTWSLNVASCKCV